MQQAGSGRLILDTPRLELREATPADAPFIRRLLTSPGWIAHISDLNIRSEADAAEYIHDKLLPEYRNQGMGLWITREKADGTAIGLCGLLRRSHLKHVDLGYAFLPEYQGQGYAREAAGACLQFGKKVIGLDRIIAVTKADNERSINLLQALGMQSIDTVIWPSGATLLVFG
jgi:ribosomal-protein-alanine N-acetyltransferase